MFIQNNKTLKTMSRVLIENLDELGSLNYNLVKLEKYFELEKNGIFARNKFEYFDINCKKFLQIFSICLWYF